MLAIYSAWAIVIVFLIVTFLQNADTLWTRADSILSVITLIGTSVGAIHIARKKLRFDSPFARGIQSILLRVTPQLFLIYTILTVGGDGFSIVFIALGHIANYTRLHIISENKKEESSKALRKSEIASWVTWCLLTLIWVYDKIK